MLESKNVLWIPHVFDPHFPLPDTSLVEFIFPDQDARDDIAEAFSETHMGEMIALNLVKPAILTSRRGNSDTARLLLNFLQQRAQDGHINKGIEVRGYNKMPD